MEYPVARKITSIGYNNGVAGFFLPEGFTPIQIWGEETGAYDA